MTPGDFGAMFVFWGFLRRPGDAMGIFWIRFQDNVAGMRRVFAMMDLPAESDLGTTQLPAIRDGISMRGCWPRLSRWTARALADVDLDAKVGEIVALVGPTGAGKTSLAYLIPRYRMASEGTVRVDGHDVNDLTLESLRSQITYVFQETQLFSDSIADNIRYGKPESDARGGGACGANRRHPRFHIFATGRLRHQARRGGGQQALGGTKAAHLHRPRPAARLRAFSFSTNRHPPWIQRLSSIWCNPCTKRPRIVWSSSSRTGYPPLPKPTRSSSWKKVRLWNKAAIVELMAKQDGHYRRFVEMQTSAAA